MRIHSYSESNERRHVAAILRNQSERAFGKLHEQHTPRLLQFAYLMLGADAAEAEDAVQETWLRAIRGLEGFRWESTLGTWLTGIALNVCRETGRKEWRRGPTLHVADDSVGVGTGGESATRLDLERAIARLPTRCRRVFLLHDWEGYTHREIGTLLNISDGTSKSQLSLAREHLRACLSPDPKKLEAPNA